MCVHVRVCVHVCVYMYVLVHVCVSSMDVIHSMIEVAATVVGGQSICPTQGSPTDSSSTLEDNPQAMKFIHKQFTVKSVGSEWPPGIKESVRNSYSTDPCLVGSIS